MRCTKYRFREFELDVASRDLLRDGERVALPPKSFECLAYLLANRNRAIGRDELIAAVWGRVEVSDMVVAQTLLRARKAIGDSGAQQSTIRTVPRFGYHWIGAVDELQTATPAVSRTEVCSANHAHAAGRPWHGWSSVLVLAVVAAFAGWLLPETMPPAHAAGAARRVVDADDEQPNRTCRGASIEARARRASGCTSTRCIRTLSTSLPAAPVGGPSPRLSAEAMPRLHYVE